MLHVLLQVENTKSPYREGGHPPPTPSSRSGASRRRIFDSYENTGGFLAKILIFRCKNTENGKSNLAALVCASWLYESERL